MTSFDLFQEKLRFTACETTCLDYFEFRNLAFPNAL